MLQQLSVSFANRFRIRLKAPQFMIKFKLKYKHEILREYLHFAHRCNLESNLQQLPSWCKFENLNEYFYLNYIIDLLF